MIRQLAELFLRRSVSFFASCTVCEFLAHSSRKSELSVLRMFVRWCSVRRSSRRAFGT